MSKIDNKNNKKKSNLRTIISVLLLIISGVLFSINPIRTHLMGSTLANNDTDKTKIIAESAKNLTNNKAQNYSKAKNDNENGTKDSKQKQNNSNIEQKNDKNNSNDVYNFNNVESLNLSNVQNAKNNVDYSSANGAIAIPTVDILLPIFNGLDNYKLTYGVGTMKINQKMGEGNYSLAGHNYPDNPKILFSPLPNIRSGDTIYITDFEYVYEYKTDYIKIINPTDTFVINDSANKKELTLITCNNDGSKRYLVKASYIDKTPLSNASNDLKNLFHLS